MRSFDGRHGVDETPRLRRFGRVRWTEDHGETKVPGFREQGYDDRHTEREATLGDEPLRLAAAEEAPTALPGLRTLSDATEESGAILPAAAAAVPTVLAQGPRRRDRWRLCRGGDLDDAASRA